MKPTGKEVYKKLQAIKSGLNELIYSCISPVTQDLMS